MRHLLLCFVLATGLQTVPHLFVGQLPDPDPLEWSVTIDGPKKGKASTFVPLICTTPATAKRIKWQMLGGSDEMLWPIEEGRRCLLVVPVGGVYTVQCIASRSDGEFDSVRAEIEIEGGAPQPGPSPNPAPTPKPPLPPGKYGLAQVVADLCAKLPGDRELFRQIAANYDAKASKAAAGAIRDVKGLIDETRAANAATVGAERERLIPPLFQPLADAISRAAPGDLASHCEAWREIAVGFSRGGE
jgi:hypothetical protein